jgi:flagellar hook-associated protein FlgK
MKNRTAILFTFMALLAAGGATACKTNSANNTAPPVVNAANTSIANTAIANTANTPVSGISLATPTEAYKTAYAVRQKGDIEGLKKVMSKEVIAFMTDMGKANNKTLDDMLKETVKDPQNPSDEVRNEKITGDRATLEYLKKDGTWKVMDFEKDGNDWKMALPKPDPSEKGPKQPE